MNELELNEGLLQQIELKRQLMIQSGMETGLHSQQTLHLSKQVDHLMNKFNQFDNRDLTMTIQNNHLK